MISKITILIICFTLFDVIPLTGQTIISDDSLCITYYDVETYGAVKHSVSGDLGLCDGFAVVRNGVNPADTALRLTVMSSWGGNTWFECMHIGVGGFVVTDQWAEYHGSYPYIKIYIEGGRIIAGSCFDWSGPIWDGSQSIKPSVASSEDLLHVIHAPVGTVSRGILYSRPMDQLVLKQPLVHIAVPPVADSAYLMAPFGYDIAADTARIAAIQITAPDVSIPGSFFGRIYLFQSPDEGATWTSRLLTDTLGTYPHQRAYLDPHVSIDHAGRIHVFWSTITCTGPGEYQFDSNNVIMHWSEQTGVHVAVRATDIGWGPNSDISNNGQNIGFLGQPSCTVDSLDNLYLIFQGVHAESDSDGQGHSYYHIWGVSSTDHGLTWLEPRDLAPQRWGYDMTFPSAGRMPAYGEILTVYNGDPYTGNQVSGNHPPYPVESRVLRFDPDMLVTSVNDSKDNRPIRLRLDQNYPNPFNPTTTIRFTLERSGQVKMILYNVLGEEVVKLLDEHCPAGGTQVRWDGRDSRGRALSSGVYLYRLEFMGRAVTRKMILLR